MKIKLFIRNIEHSGCILITVIHEDIVGVITTIMIDIMGCIMEDTHIMVRTEDYMVDMGYMVDIHIYPRVAIYPRAAIHHIIEDPASVQHSVFY